MSYGFDTVVKNQRKTSNRAASTTHLLCIECIYYFPQLCLFICSLYELLMLLTGFVRSDREYKPKTESLGSYIGITVLKSSLMKN